MLVLANLFWGLSFPLIKAIVYAHQLAVPESSTWFLTAYTVAPRFLLATLVLLVVLRRQLGTITGAEWKQGLLIGATAGAGIFFQNDGLQFTSASTSAFLTQLYAVMIPAWIALRSRRWPSGLVLGCSVLVLAGVAVLGRFDFRALHLGRGEIETLVCSVFFMMQILLLERKDFAANRPLPVSLVMFAVQTVLFSALAVGTTPTLGALVVPWTQPGWLGLTLMLTVFSTLGAYILMTAFQPKITATEAGLIYCGEPVFASVMALFLPAVISGWIGINYANETVTWHLLVGGGLITLANLLLQLNPPAKIS